MRRLLPLLLPLVLGLVACSRCGKGASGTADLTRALPKDADMVAVIPKLGNLGEKVAVLQRLKLANFASQLRGFSSAEEAVNAVVAQAGVDIRSPEALRQAGIDPDLGLGIAAYGNQKAYVVLGVHDAKALQNTVGRLARDRLGARVQSESEAGGVRYVVYSDVANGPPELGIAFKDRLAFIAAGYSAKFLTSYPALAPGTTVADSAPLAAGLARLPADRDFYVQFPPEASRSANDPLSGVTFAGKLAQDGITLRADVPWPNTRSSLDVLVRKDGPDLFPVLPHDAFAVARFSGEPSLLAPFLPFLWGRSVDRAVAESGFDAKAQVLDNLKPGAVVALALSPEAKLSGGVPTLDVRRTNPFRFVHLVAAAKVKDAAKAAQLFDVLPPLAEKVGATLTPAAREGHKVLLASYAQGEGTHLALDGDTLLLAAPEPRLLDALKQVDAPTQGAVLSDPTLMKAFENQALVAVVDLRRLSDAVKALPENAWGVGGFAMKATTVRWLEATDDLRAITVAVSAKESALQAELTLRLSPP